MDELSALALISDRLPEAGDDAAIIDDLVLTIDMLHDETDFPSGTTAYTIGWRSVGASLSDIAAMGGTPIGAVAAYGSPTFEPATLDEFIDGAVSVCESVDCSYVGGDLDTHQELTIASAVVGRTPTPVFRSGAAAGEAVYVTGTLGRSAAAIAHMESGETERANTLMQFAPRISTGQSLAGVATAMMDSSDGLARSLYQLAKASNCGFSITSEMLPIAPSLTAISTNAQTKAIHFGEDFELVCTANPAAIAPVIESASIPITRIGSVVESGVTLDGEKLPNKGYEHGSERV